MAQNLVPVLGDRGRRIRSLRSFTSFSEFEASLGPETLPEEEMGNVRLKMNGTWWPDAGALTCQACAQWEPLRVLEQVKE